MTVLCQALEVSESGYSGWKHREASQHCREDARLAAEIQQIYLDHRKLYGSPRIHAALQACGIATSRKRVLRLMRQLGISAQKKRTRPPDDEQRSISSLCRKSAQPRFCGSATQYQMGDGYQSGRNG